MLGVGPGRYARSMPTRSTSRPTIPAITWSPACFVFRDRAEDVVRSALATMRLSPLIREVHVRVDVEDFGDDAHITWSVRRPYSVLLELDLGNFLTRCGRRKLARSAPHHTQINGRRFSARTLEGTLLHELSHLRDDAVHGIDCDKIPRALRSAFNEVWNVWIDGRLRRRGVPPAVTKRERRAIFGLTFGRVAGRRREVFERLWRSERLSHKELLAHLEVLEP